MDIILYTVLRSYIKSERLNGRRFLRGSMGGKEISCKGIKREIEKLREGVSSCVKYIDIVMGIYIRVSVEIIRMIKEKGKEKSKVVVRERSIGMKEVDIVGKVREVYKYEYRVDGEYEYEYGKLDFERGMIETGPHINDWEFDKMDYVLTRVKPGLMNEWHKFHIIKGTVHTMRGLFQRETAKEVHFFRYKKWVMYTEIGDLFGFQEEVIVTSKEEIKRKSIILVENDWEAYLKERNINRVSKGRSKLYGHEGDVFKYKVKINVFKKGE